MRFLDKLRAAIRGAVGRARGGPPPGAAFNRPARGPRPEPRPPGNAPQAETLSHNERELADGAVITMASSNVEAITWRMYGPPKPDGVLWVRFKSGGVYRYENVPLAVAVAFVETDSPGRFVWNHLRDKYPYAKVGTMPPRPKPNVVRLVNRREA